MIKIEERKVFKFETLNKLWVQLTLRIFLKKVRTEVAISKLMKVIIDRENTKKNQPSSKRLKLKEVEEYVKIKKA